MTESVRIRRSRRRSAFMDIYTFLHKASVLSALEEKSRASEKKLVRIFQDPLLKCGCSECGWHQVWWLFPEDSEKRGRKRVFLSNERKRGLKNVKALIQAGSQGPGAATSLGGGVSRGSWIRARSHEEAPRMTLVRGSSRCLRLSSVPQDIDSGPLAFNLLTQTNSPRSPCTHWAEPAGELQGEECVSINRVGRLSQTLMTGMSRFLKGTAVTYSHPTTLATKLAMSSFPQIIYEFTLQYSFYNSFYFVLSQPYC